MPGKEVSDEPAIEAPATTKRYLQGTGGQLLLSSPFTLTGTGTFQGTSNILVNYSGTACGIAVAGSDTITRS